MQLQKEERQLNRHYSMPLANTTHIVNHCHKSNASAVKDMPTHCKLLWKQQGIIDIPVKR